MEGYIPYMGPLEFVINGFGSGIKSGMSYSGARTLKVKITKIIYKYCYLNFNIFYRNSENMRNLLG